MALKGNLRDFSTAQLLNLVNLARKTGAMKIEAADDMASLYFKEGKLIHASTQKREGGLAEMLLHNGRLAEKQKQVISTKATGASDKALGIDLIRSGVVKQQEIVQCVKDFMLEIVYSLFSWREGQFDFAQDARPANDKITIPLNLENVILEGSRQIQETERLVDELPDLSRRALKITDKSLSDVKLNADDWRVIQHIHPRNSIEKIAKENDMDEFQIRKIVYGLLQAGLVELTKPEGLKAPAIFQSRNVESQRENETPVARRSMVERLITRIKGI